MQSRATLYSGNMERSRSLFVFVSFFLSIFLFYFIYFFNSFWSSSSSCFFLSLLFRTMRQARRRLCPPPADHLSPPFPWSLFGCSCWPKDWAAASELPVSAGRRSTSKPIPAGNGFLRACHPMGRRSIASFGSLIYATSCPYGSSS